MVGADRTIKIPQVLNGALAASVYICGAQALGPMAVETGLTPSDFDPFTCWAAVTIFIWTTKNFVDDYRAFNGPADKGFNLGFTVFFSAAAYATLAWAAASLRSGLVAAKIIAVYFVVLSLWSLFSWMRRLKIKSPSDIEKIRMRHRLRWMGYYFICAGLAAVIAYLADIYVLITYGLTIWIFYCFDAFYSKTFNTNHVEAS